MTFFHVGVNYPYDQGVEKSYCRARQDNDIRGPMQHIGVDVVHDILLILRSSMFICDLMSAAVATGIRDVIVLVEI